MTEARLDPVRYEIFYNNLDQILNEGKEVIRYLSGSTITRESGEVLEGFYLPEGEAAHVACGILMHVMNVTRCIRYMTENRYAEDIGIYDGDQFINNDAYIAGMHVPDTGIIAPFFYKDEHLGWIAALSHTSETGGIEPGGMCPSAKEAWHDGLRFPAVKLVEKGTMRRDMFNMALRGVRAPLGMELDIRARIAGNERVRQRLPGLIEEFGLDFFKAATRQLVKDAEEQARAKITGLRPGIYRSRMYSDALGAGQEVLAVIQLDMEVTKGGELIMRVPVVSPQKPGFNNAYFPAVEATIFYSLLTEMLYDARWNSGISHVVRSEVPFGSRLNADEKQSVGYATVGIGSTFCNNVTEALSRAYYASGNPQDVQAAAATVNGITTGGIDQFGRVFGNFYMSAACAQGGGGRIGKDGHDSSVTIWNPWTYIPDTEGEEMIIPILVLSQRHRPDSGGFGQQRGGTALSAVIVTHGSDQHFPCHLGTGGKFPVNQGLFGGYPAAASFADEMVDTDFYQKAEQGGPIPYAAEEVRECLEGNYIAGSPNVATRQMRSGDIIITMAPGGAGLGDPLDRDPTLVAQDIENKLTTIDTAQTVYGAVIDSKTLAVDYKRTEELRAQKRKERLRQGVPAKEYLAEMVARRKRRELPKEVLEFLDETTSFCPGFREQTEAEEMLPKRELYALKEVNVQRLLFPLTPYVNIVEDDKGKAVAVCQRCGFAYCEARENFKLYCLVYDRDPQTILPGRWGYDRQRCVFREFYCPGCGTQVEVEATPPGTPILQSYSLTWD